MSAERVCDRCGKRESIVEDPVELPSGWSRRPLRALKSLRFSSVVDNQFVDLCEPCDLEVARFATEAPDAPEAVLFRGRIDDTGGGFVTVFVDRDTEQYPDPGQKVVVSVDADA